ncbi:MAG TPA: hypothetical protein V6C81_21260 [Planktothrix sp.]|jgi:hypothetical protein
MITGQTTVNEKSTTSKTIESDKKWPYLNFEYTLSAEQQSSIQLFLRACPFDKMTEEGKQVWQLLHRLTYSYQFEMSSTPKHDLLAEEIDSTNFFHDGMGWKTDDGIVAYVHGKATPNRSLLIPPVSNDNAMSADADS